MYNIVFSIFIIIIVVFFILKRNKDNIDKLLLVSLYFYHLLFVYIYYKMSLGSGFDALSYYTRVFNNLDSYKFEFFVTNTSFIENIVYLLIKYLNLTYFNSSLLFGSIGYFACYLLYLLLIQNTRRVLVLLLFLPGLHFWSSGLGKDSLMFFAMVFFIYALHKEKIIFIFLASLFIYIIRPHIFIIMSAGIVPSIMYSFFVLKYKYSLFIKMSVASFLLYTSYIIICYIFFHYLNSYSISIDKLIQYVNNSQSWYPNANSNIDMSEYNVIERICTFLFRPFFENINFKYIVISFENLIYILLGLYIVYNVKYVQLNNYVTIFNVFFLLIAILIFSYTIGGNLGIAVRYKIMLIPSFYYLLFEIYNWKNKFNDKIVSFNKH